MKAYTQVTPLLDFENNQIQALVMTKDWLNKDTFEQIKEIYNFVRDDIKFGYNTDDYLPASQILKEGYGQCNTKAILLMALFRSLGIPCRLHGFTIDKRLQKGAMNGPIYWLAPKNIVHSWVEVYFEETWFNLEGFILDQPYLGQLQRKFVNHVGSFCGYGVATSNLFNPQIEWNRNDTYIQKEGINRDFGIFDSPDDFFRENRQALSGLKKLVFVHFGRHLMNRAVDTIRKK